MSESNGYIEQVKDSANKVYDLHDKRLDGKTFVWEKGEGQNSAQLSNAECEAIGQFSVAEGWGSKATSAQCHAEGYRTQATGGYSHSEGDTTVASGSSSHTEGWGTQAIGAQTHAEGRNTIAEGDYSHAEGYETQANENSSHAEGYLTEANGNYSHAEGRNTEANEDASHAEGHYTEANGIGSHAEGLYTEAEGGQSHAEGGYTISSAMFSHSEGYKTKAQGRASHAGGEYTITTNRAEYALGRVNNSHKASDDWGDSGNTLSSIGIGEINSNDFFETKNFEELLQLDNNNELQANESLVRKNAVEVMQNGDVYIIGIGGYDGTNITSALTVQQVINNLTEAVNGE